MEAYFPVVSKIKANGKSSSTSPVPVKDGVGLRAKATSFVQPAKTPQYERYPNVGRHYIEVIYRIQDYETRLSSSEITAGLLTTLSDVSNPICHSNIAERSGRIARDLYYLAQR